MTDHPRFERVLIVNRGEPAMRLIAAVREINGTRTKTIRTIALYTEPDRDAKFVREADETYLLGDALFTDADGMRKSTYLDYAKLRAALTETRADAAWVAGASVAEHADSPRSARSSGSRSSARSRR